MEHDAMQKVKMEAKPLVPSNFAVKALSSLLFLICIPLIPIGTILGLIVFFAFRKKEPFAAYVGMQASAWQGFAFIASNTLLAIMLMLFRMCGYTDEAFRSQLLFERGLFALPTFWTTLSVPLQTIIAMALVLFVIHLIVTVYGAYMASQGKIIRVPVVGTMVAKAFDGK